MRIVVSILVVSAVALGSIADAVRVRCRRTAAEGDRVAP
jgi:hypothetical protein